ncbi:MAG: Rab family GTPase [candidate division KSB1 bacterium]
MIQKKVCILGMFGVGKTSLVRRFVQQEFGEKYLTTLGVKVDHKLVAVENERVNLLLWDIAGQEEESSVIANYFRGAHGALIVYDLTRPDSAQTLREYCERFLRVTPKAKLVFVGNKSDLVEASKAAVLDFGQILGQKSVAHFFTSAKTGDNVEPAFIKLTQMLLA